MQVYSPREAQKYSLKEESVKQDSENTPIESIETPFLQEIHEATEALVKDQIKEVKEEAKNEPSVPEADNKKETVKNIKKTVDVLEYLISTNGLMWHSAASIGSFAKMFNKNPFGLVDKLDGIYKVAEFNSRFIDAIPTGLNSMRVLEHGNKQAW